MQEFQSRRSWLLLEHLIESTPITLWNNLGKNTKQMGQIMHLYINASMNVQMLQRCVAYAHMCNAHFVKKGELQMYQLREIYI